MGKLEKNKILNKLSTKELKKQLFNGEIVVADIEWKNLQIRSILANRYNAQ